MESESTVLGKINKKKVYLNNGKYGHYLNHDSKNYKVPEWMPVDKLDIDIAERLIEYKKNCPPNGVKQNQQAKTKARAKAMKK